MGVQAAIAVAGLPDTNNSSIQFLTWFSQNVWLDKEERNRTLRILHTSEGSCFTCVFNLGKPRRSSKQNPSRLSPLSAPHP